MAKELKAATKPPTTNLDEISSPYFDANDSLETTTSNRRGYRKNWGGGRNGYFFQFVFLFCFLDFNIMNFVSSSFAAVAISNSGEMSRSFCLLEEAISAEGRSAKEKAQATAIIMDGKTESRMDQDYLACRNLKKRERSEKVQIETRTFPYFN